MLCITVFLCANKGLLCTDRSQLYQLSVSSAARTFITEIYKAFHSVIHACDFKNIWHLSTNFDSFQLLKTEKSFKRYAVLFNGGGEAKWNSLSGPHPRAVVSWSHPSFQCEWVVEHSGNNRLVLQDAVIEDIALKEFLFSFYLFIWYTQKKNFGDMVFSHTWLPSLKLGFGYFF